MNTVQRIAKNTSLLFISQIITYAIAFITLAYMVRYLGVENFGILSFALSFAGILIIFTDLGLSSLMTREVARDKSKIGQYITNVILLKIALTAVSALFSLGFIYLLGYDAMTMLIIFLVIFSYIFNSFTITFYSLFQAVELMEFQSIGQILNAFLLLVGVMVVIYYGFGLLGIAVAYFITGGITVLYTIAIYIRKYSLPKMKFNKDFSSDFLKKALPLSMTLIFSTIAFRVDTVLLSILVGNVAVGLYTAPYRLMEVLMFIPGVFTAAIYPVASNFYVSNKDSLKVVYKKSFEYLTMLSIPIAVMVTLLADKIILLVYGAQFSETVIVLQILIWAIPFIFLNYVFSTLMVSINRQHLALKVVFISMGLNIVLNLIFIPLFSYLGSSVITIITELTDFILYFYLLSRYLHKIELQNVIVKPAVAGLVMGLFIYYVNIPLLLSIIVAPLLYFIVLNLLRAFSKEDFDILKQIIGMRQK